MVKSYDGLFTNYRDVAEVDGKPVKDRNDRALAAVHGRRRAGAGDARQGGRRRRAPQPRHAAPHVERADAAAVRPAPEARRPLRLRARGTETIEGTPTTVVRFSEKRGPTFIRTTRHDDVFTNGRLWITADGRVLQTALRVDERDTGVVVRIDVTYRDVPSLGLLMPAEMRESYTNLPGDRQRSIEGRATYGNYRTFRVVTVTTSDRAAGIR